MEGEREASAQVIFSIPVKHLIARKRPLVNPESASITTLHGRWLLIARTTWLVLVVLTLGVFITSAPARFVQHQTDDIVIEVALLSVYVGIAAVIFWRKSKDGMALFVSLFLVMWGATLSPSWDALVESESSWHLPVSLLRSLGPLSFLLFLYLFPDGRFVPRWTRTLVVALIALMVVAKPFGPLMLPDPLSFILWVGFLVAGVAAQIYRYRRISGPVQRQQTKWVVFGLTAMSLGLLVSGLMSELFPSLHRSGVQQSLYELISGSVAVFSLLLLPVSIGIAILRSQLFDIDLLINRALVYGALTVSIIGLYVLGVGALSRLLQTQSNLAVSILALLIVAALIRPLRRGLQRGANRLIRPERSPPADSSAAPKLPTTELSQSQEATLHTPMRPENAPNTTLHGQRLVLARAVWVAVALLTVGLFVAGIPVEFAQLQLGCPTPACASSGQMTPVELRLVEDLGLSRNFFAAYGVALEVVFAGVYAAVAALIFWRKSTDRLALFVALALLAFGTATHPSTMNHLTAAYPVWRLPVAALHFVGSASFSLFLYLFPDGRFVPRWTRWVALVWIAWLLPRYWFPDWPPSGSDTWLAWPNSAVWLGALGTAVYAQVYRYRRVSNRVQRQQTKWVVFGIGMALTGFLSVNVVVSAVGLPAPASAGALATLMVGAALMYGALLLIPLSIGIAILRHHLFDIDILINRTLVYGALTVSVVGIYVLVVGYLGALFRMAGGQANLAISVLATGLVALLFQPLRGRLQRGVNRLMYGPGRDDPYAVLSRLGQRLEATLAPEAVLPTIVATVKESLKLPYTAIALKHADADAFAVAAASGIPVDDVLHLPLVYQNETVGQLLLAPRAPGEAFSAADQRLLDDLAHQAGVAVHAVRLTTDLQRLAADLQRSRESLVTTREEERRRLRRDLHDGLGPTLASLAQRLDTARILVPRDPDAAVALLGDLKAQVKATITDIRQLVYALRPPALDELGLVSAIREHIAHYDQPNGLHVSIDAPERLPPLPAAVEVAAYRIVLEALTNVARHAHAQTCRIRLDLTEAPALCLEITDDGGGLPPDYHAGVGLTSMRERAAELGGECRIEPGPTQGTQVWARLPLPPLEE